MNILEEMGRGVEIHILWGSAANHVDRDQTSNLDIRHYRTVTLKVRVY